MRFMIFVLADANTEAGVMPDAKLLSEMGKYNEELVKAGVMLDGAGLHPTSKASRLTWGERGFKVTDGPFTESKELICGYWLWKCDSRDEAVAWLKHAPFGPGARLEIRQLFEAGDFGEA